MKKKLLFYLMMLSGLGFSASTAWLMSDILASIDIKKFEVDSIFTFVLSMFIFGLLHMLYNCKTKYVKRKVTPINKYYGVTEDSQNPIKL